MKRERMKGHPERLLLALAIFVIAALPAPLPGVRRTPALFSRRRAVEEESVR